MEYVPIEEVIMMLLKQVKFLEKELRKNNNYE